MKLLKHPLQVRTAALLVSWLIRGWGGSLNWRFVVDDPSTIPSRSDRRLLYLFWHETILLPAYSHARLGIPILVSRHRDGELIAQVLHMLGGAALRGSTTRGGAVGVRQMLRQGRRRHLALTPDGPQGPRRRVQQGAAYLAWRADLAVTPVGFDCSMRRRAGSWDRMILPCPMADAWGVLGAPIPPPTGLTRAELQEYRSRIQQGMDDAQARAEAYAAGRRPNGPVLSLSQLT